MITLKKYANGQFFDTVNKKYIKIAALKEMVQKGEKIKVTMSKTGKDITKSILEQFSKKEGAAGKIKTTGKKAREIKKEPGEKPKTSFIKTDSIKKWAGKLIDNRIAQVFEAIKLPSRRQIEQLDANIKALNEKIDKLQALQSQKASASSKAAKEKAPADDSSAPKNEAADTGRG